MDVHVAVFERVVGAQAERPSTGSRVRQRCLRGLFHHFAQLPGQQQIAFARHHPRFDEQHLATRRRIRQPGCHADLVLAGDDLLLKVRRSELLDHAAVRHRHRAGIAHDNRPSRFARHGRDLPLEVAHPGFAGVLANDPSQSRVRKTYLANSEAVLGQLARDQIAFGDLQFVVLGVARQIDDFEPVAQRRRHGIEHVGGRDEQHARQIEWHVQIVIAEIGVLGWVEHLEQRRRRISSPVIAQFVELVQDEHRIARARTPQGLDNPPGQRTDIRAAVAADLGFVAHSAQAHVHELAAERSGDRLAETGLADTWRPDQAQDRAARVGRWLIVAIGA